MFNNHYRSITKEPLMPIGPNYFNWFNDLAQNQLKLLENLAHTDTKSYMQEGFKNYDTLNDTLKYNISGNYKYCISDSNNNYLNYYQS